MANQATYDDANLILRLYELRREEKLRRAREWFSANFHASTLEDVNRLAPQGSQENAYMRMVISYWDMAASFVASGVLNQELFFKTSGECLFVWERVRELAPAMRAFQEPQCVGQPGNRGQRLYQAHGSRRAGSLSGVSSHGARHRRGALIRLPKPRLSTPIHPAARQAASRRCTPMNAGIRLFSDPRSSAFIGGR